MRITGFFRTLLCVLLVLLLLTPTALADLPDLSQLTNDEVAELLTLVNAEVVKRGITTTAKLPQGAYIGGKDVPAGRYIFTSLATGDDWGNVTVYSEGGKGDLLIWEVVSAPKNGAAQETIFISLNDGDELKSGVPFSLQIMTGVLFQ